MTNISSNPTNTHHPSIPYLPSKAEGGRSSLKRRAGAQPLLSLGNEREGEVAPQRRFTKVPRSAPLIIVPIPPVILPAPGLSESPILNQLPSPLPATPSPHYILAAARLMGEARHQIGQVRKEGMELEAITRAGSLFSWAERHVEHIGTIEDHVILVRIVAIAKRCLSGRPADLFSPRNPKTTPLYLEYWPANEQPLEKLNQAATAHWDPWLRRLRSKEIELQKPILFGSWGSTRHWITESNRDTPAVIVAKNREGELEGYIIFTNPDPKEGPAIRYIASAPWNSPQLKDYPELMTGSEAAQIGSALIEEFVARGTTPSQRPEGAQGLVPFTRGLRVLYPLEEADGFYDKLRFEKSYRRHNGKCYYKDRGVWWEGMGAPSNAPPRSQVRAPRNLYYFLDNSDQDFGSYWVLKMGEEAAAAFLSSERAGRALIPLPPS